MNEQTAKLTHSIQPTEKDKGPCSNVTRQDSHQDHEDPPHCAETEKDKDPPHCNDNTSSGSRHQDHEDRGNDKPDVDEEMRAKVVETNEDKDPPHQAVPLISPHRNDKSDASVDISSSATRLDEDGGNDKPNADEEMRAKAGETNEDRDPVFCLMTDSGTPLLPAFIYTEGVGFGARHYITEQDRCSWLLNVHPSFCKRIYFQIAHSSTVWWHLYLFVILGKGEPTVTLELIRNRLAEAHAEHLDRGCKLTPKIRMESRFSLSILYIECQGCNTYEVVI
ncbi:hypothetical protein POM88_026802 [Heracleum sosnowskyi]|uniref:RPA-interacting protein C-terminal domain-containing protein n=1 Tax=Heracleum sosnowskyi TaxID=360622 RepID=A0AAD8MQF4_9APIA|nr:hypothetical protein POM88_026802 [Heracleum sosnowskyi]